MVQSIERGKIAMTLQTQDDWQEYKRQFGYGVISHTIYNGKQIVHALPFPCKIESRIECSITDRAFFFVKHYIKGNNG